MVCSAPTSSCTVTEYSQLADTISSGTDLHISHLTVPRNTTLDLSKVKANTVITFEGCTFWEYANATYDLLKVGGTNITIQGAACSVLDGNGPAWWDGIGSNGGVPKPQHMITGSKLVGKSVIKNLYIKNAPTHIFSISGAFGLVMKAIVIDMKEGYTLLPTYCSGSHGLSIGSIGGKSNNTVDGVVFSNSNMLNSQNGARIKANLGNIAVSNISDYGIDVQQDYHASLLPLQLGAVLTACSQRRAHRPPNPRRQHHQHLHDPHPRDAQNYYILTVPGTNADSWHFSDSDITGGDNNTCLVHPTGLNC
ncbi:glycoside hydrolase family 28 protein [Calocera cornea HHB12733]|uniref:Glycoside hydrolase family 28 protein n=1 Tax=Calocera cornea HHB12733 TaxID=1353952 RepID=A0A165IXS4_9BASI|nr:glycoside hydrolase family 28 protein [Calocera cornea HHB12733]